MAKDLFAPVPEFLAAFKNIQENGFFESVQFICLGSDGRIRICKINIAGCVPSSSEYMADGCGLIVDPNTIIDSCRELATKNKIKNIETKVETENWLLYDSTGEKVLGSKGNRIELFLTVTFKT